MKSTKGFAPVTEKSLSESSQSLLQQLVNAVAHVRLVSCSREACEGIESVRRVAAWTALPPCGCVGLRALRCAAASALRCATATAVELTALTRLGAHVASDALDRVYFERARSR